MSNKPEWKDAPDWAMWLAQDKDGDWYWWQDKPCIYHQPFWMPDADDAGEIEIAKPAKFNTIIDGWGNNLEPRP